MAFFKKSKDKSKEIKNEEQSEQPEAKPKKVCSECEGSGLKDKKEHGRQAEKLCKICNGTGQIT